MDSAIRGSKCIFFATDWPEFKDNKALKKISKGTLIVDCMNMLNLKTFIRDNHDYIGVGL